MKKLIVISTLALSLIVGSSGCRTRAVVETRPEPLAVAVRPAPPHADYVWIDGEWIWSGGKYVYTNGYWAPPRAGHVWAAGHWVGKGHGWYWERGHWR